MKRLEERNIKIIDAVIEKAGRVCPGSLALIGIYGSFQTGDFYEKSDLDLMIVINDDNGWQLSSTFIQEDLQVGHDLYCTTWESLEQDADYLHPHISRLMDSRIVYCAEEVYRERLETLRCKANTILRAPFSKTDFEKADNHLRQAEQFYARAMCADNLAGCFAQAAHMLYELQNAVAMLNKTYYRYGVKRIFEEIDGMERKPHNFRELTNAILCADSVESVKQNLTALLRETIRVFRSAEQGLLAGKQPATANALRGTYEEMFSNWRNKIHSAAAANDRHLLFNSLAAMQEMLTDIRAETKIGEYDLIGCYNPADLSETARACDEMLQQYLQEYQTVDLEPRLYPDIDAFIEDYLK